MPQLTLYKTSSPNNTVGKKLENMIKIPCSLKGENNVLRPNLTIRFSSNYNINDYNYCYIDALKRYYYITDIDFENNKFIRLNLRVDVLETYKDDILKSKCDVKQSESFNPYYDDGSYKVTEEFEGQTYISEDSVEMQEHLILVSMG